MKKNKSLEKVEMLLEDWTKNRICDILCEASDVDAPGWLVSAEMNKLARRLEEARKIINSSNKKLNVFIKSSRKNTAK